MKDKLEEIIEYLNTTYEEFDVAIDNYDELFKRYKIDINIDSIADVDMNTVTTYGGEKYTRYDVDNYKCTLEEFLHDYYKEVIKCVCNVIETFKDDEDEN